MAEIFPGADLDAADLREVGLVGPAEKAGQAAGPVLKLAGAVEVLDALVERFIEADHHGRGGAQTGIDDRSLGFEILRYGVFELAVATAKIFGEDLRAAAGDPAFSCLFEALSGLGVVESGVIGEVHELGDGERIEFEAIAVAGADGGEEIAVIVERKVGVESAVEGREVAAERE